MFYASSRLHLCASNVYQTCIRTHTYMCIIHKPTQTYIYVNHTLLDLHMCHTNMYVHIKCINISTSSIHTVHVHHLVRLHVCVSNIHCYHTYRLRNTHQSIWVPDPPEHPHYNLDHSHRIRILPMKGRS